MPLDRADARDFGLPCEPTAWRLAAAPGSPELLQSGFQLDIPRMLATLFPIALAGVAPFVFMIALSKRALGQWHESEIGADA